MPFGLQHDISGLLCSDMLLTSHACLLTSVSAANARTSKHVCSSCNDSCSQVMSTIACLNSLQAVQACSLAKISTRLCADMVNAGISGTLWYDGQGKNLQLCYVYIAFYNAWLALQSSHWRTSQRKMQSLDYCSALRGSLERTDLICLIAQPTAVLWFGFRAMTVLTLAIFWQDRQDTKG